MKSSIPLVLLCLAGRGVAATWDPFAGAEERRNLQAALASADAGLAGLPPARTGAQVHQRIGFHGKPGHPASITVDLGSSVRPDDVVLLAARSPVQIGDLPTSGFPPDVRALLSQSGEDGTFEPMDEWHEEAEDSARDLPLLRLRGNGRAGRYLRLEIRGARNRQHLDYFTLGEVVVLEAGVDRALGAPVLTSQAIDSPPHWQAGNLTDGFLWCDALLGRAQPARYGYHCAVEADPRSPKWVEVDLGAAVAIDEVRLVPAHPGNFADVAGFGFPVRFSVEAYADGGEGPPVILFDTADQPYPSPGDATVCLSARGVTARRVRVAVRQLCERSNDYIFALAELEVLAHGRNVALGRPVIAKDSVQSGSWSTDALVDGSNSQRALLQWPAWLDEQDRRTRLLTERNALADRLARLDRDHQATVVRTLGVLAATLFVAAVALLLGLRWRQHRDRERLRLRLARDLHDEVGSRLSHLALLAEAEAGTDASASASAPASFAREVREVQRSMRDFAWLTDPANGDAQDVASRLRVICQQLLDPAVPEVRIEARGRPPARRLPLTWSREVMLFVRESLSNCARHSGSPTADIVLEWTMSAFVFDLHDAGRGFDERAPGFVPGSGLRNLRARAQALGAEFACSSTPGGGTRIRLRAPLPRSSWIRRLVTWGAP